MRFASAITEYILPGLPVTAVLVYGIHSLMARPLPEILETQQGPVAVVIVPALLLGVAYMLGVIVHYLARWVLLDWYEDQERKTWNRFRPYCLPRLGLLGLSASDEFRSLRLDQPGEDETRPEPGPGTVILLPLRFLCDCIVGRVKNRKEPDLSGWVLWRMRLFLCDRAPSRAQEVLQLQAISRAARGAFALPLSLVMWVLVDFGNHLHVLLGPPSDRPTNWALLVALLVLGLVLMRAVRWTYSYRWGVVCRSTVAAFLSVDRP